MDISEIDLAEKPATLDLNKRKKLAAAESFRLDEGL